MGTFGKILFVLITTTLLIALIFIIFERRKKESFYDKYTPEEKARFDKLKAEIVESQQDSFFKNASPENKKLFMKSIDTILKESDLTKFENNKNGASILTIGAIMVYKSAKQNL